MRNEPLVTDNGNRTYQRQMAENLIQSLGMDGAIDACFQNDWIGTLSIILKDDPSVACHPEDNFGL